MGGNGGNVGYNDGNGGNPNHNGGYLVKSRWSRWKRELQLE